MSERKTVIIDIEENEKTRLGEMSDIESVEASGVISVNNVSGRSRIWNVRVLLADSRDRTDIEDEELQAGEVEAGGKWESSYGLTVDAPILTLTETYDTCSSEAADTQWAYAYGKENSVRITIHLKNETDGELDNIVLNKTIADELTNVRVESVKSGTAEFDEGTRQIIWKDFVIFPQEESEIVITAIGSVEDAEVKSAGEVVATYRGEGQQRSSLLPDMTALTEFLTGIETAETEPNQWECTLECSNESDLIVRLDKAEVFVEPEAGGEKEKKINELPGVEMEPGQSWSSTFEIGSKSPPKCTQDIEYTPSNLITSRVLGTIDKTAQSIPVYRVEYTKEFDPPEVSSFDKTPVEVTIEIKNAGSAKLNEIVVVDVLPEDVKPPVREYIEVYIRGEEHTGDFEFIIDPDDQDPETSHTLTFKVKNLKDSGGELAPGEVLKINYSIMTWKNRPEKEYPAPIHISANIYPPGLMTEIASAEDGHRIGVVYKKRRISAKKAINKGSEAGEYIVLLVIENKGEVTVENVKVTDWIPAGFEYVSVEPADLEPSQATADSGTDLIWSFERMNPGDQKRIRVTVKGEGEYERREPEVTSD